MQLAGPGVALRGVGWWGNRNRQQGVLGYDYTLAGFVAGFDTSLRKTGWTLGGAFSYTRANMDVNRGVSHSDADNFLFGANAG